MEYYNDTDVDWDRIEELKHNNNISNIGECSTYFYEIILDSLPDRAVWSIFIDLINKIKSEEGHSKLIPVKNQLNFDIVKRATQHYYSQLDFNLHEFLTSVESGNNTKTNDEIVAANKIRLNHIYMILEMWLIKKDNSDGKHSKYSK